MQEPYFEKVLRRLRLKKIIKDVPAQSTLLDVGCGWESKLLKSISPHIKLGYGIDFKVEKLDDGYSHLKVFQLRFENKPWPIESESCDVVTMLAVLEHIEPENALVTLSEIKRILKPNGKLLVTVPTPMSRPLLEFLAYKLHIINEGEIRDHKIYYSRESLLNLLKQNGFMVQSYETFQLGFNSKCVAIKNNS